MKKGLDAMKKYPKITTAKWKTFVEQKTSAEFLSKSQANSELANKNIYHHRLGRWLPACNSQMEGRRSC
jgi:hypothetical protein